MAASGGAAVAVIANATKASGAIVKAEPSDFHRIVPEMDAPLVVGVEGGVLSKKTSWDAVPAAS